MKTCIFCRIAARQANSHVIFEDAEIIAFLDLGHIRPGHTQIIPKEHIPYFDDLSPEVSGKIMALGQRLAKIMKRIYSVPRVAFCFTGGDIAHAHAHIVPMHEKTDITSARFIADPNVTFQDLPRTPDAELFKCASRLREELDIKES